MSAVLKFVAMSDGESGGLSAGVCLMEDHGDEEAMQAIAAASHCSQTAFVAPVPGGWKVRYFSAKAELEFGSHATVAVGAALTRLHGDGMFVLTAVDKRIIIEGRRAAAGFLVSMQSPATRSAPAPGPLAEAVLEIFDFGKVDLHKRIPSARVTVGADHLVIGLASREALVARHYGLAACRLLMTSAGLETIVLAWPETTFRFHIRNPFMSAGSHDDPASIAGASALASYLRDLQWPPGALEIVQGEGTDRKAVLRAEAGEQRGTPVKISALARFIG